MEGYPRLMDLSILMKYISIGRDGARAFGKAAGAVVKYEGKTLYDRLKIDAYILKLEDDGN